MQKANQPDDEAPDTAASYERAKPEKESGMGRLDNNDDATPTDQPSHIEKTVPNRQDPQQQLNAEELDDDRENRPLSEKQRWDNPDQPDHSMLEEEPLGWDQAPQRIENPQHKRHSRKEGRGGTP